MTFANFLDLGVPHSQLKQKLINISGERGMNKQILLQRVLAGAYELQHLKADNNTTTNEIARTECSASSHTLQRTLSSSSR